MGLLIAKVGDMSNVLHDEPSKKNQWVAVLVTSLIGTGLATFLVVLVANWMQPTTVEQTVHAYVSSEEERAKEIEINVGGQIKKIVVPYRVTKIKPIKKTDKVTLVPARSGLIWSWIVIGAAILCGLFFLVLLFWAACCIYKNPQ